jgi:hypothetical protein
MMKTGRPKNVPRDYLRQIQKSLKNDGVELNTEKIRNILRGKINDQDLTIAVAGKLKNVRDEHRKKLRELKKIRKNLKK